MENLSPLSNPIFFKPIIKCKSKDINNKTNTNIIYIKYLFLYTIFYYFSSLGLLSFMKNTATSDKQMATMTHTNACLYIVKS